MSATYGMYKGLPLNSPSDICIFKDKLKNLPLQYLVHLFKNYPSLKDALYNLARVCRELAEGTTTTMNDKHYKVAGIPQFYWKDTQGDFEKEYNALLEVSLGLKTIPCSLYFSSVYSDTAMERAFTLMKTIIAKRKSVSDFSVYTLSLPEYIEKVKESWKAPEISLPKIETADLLVVYFVGYEYVTEFTSTILRGLLMNRKVNGKSTVICSSLSPEEFYKQYSYCPPDLVTFSFKEPSKKKTITELIQEIRKGMRE